jgi:toxin ParE1/3/4
MKVRYSAQSRADLNAIREYIAQDSPITARRFVQRLRVGIRQLATFPELGSIVEAWDRQDLRELIIGNYRVIYQMVSREVWIITISHAARKLPRQPEE